ncbi:MAG TPA: sulfite exporter TauE/SafE family protein [Mycobacteriales bacterium]|nr:sulfite exporter TauE/SafE family protein [Mycobacteriales bacterium]
MGPLQDLAIVGAGLVAGAMNAVVGSGSLLTFPTLLAVGYPSVLANVSNTVGISPGSVSAVVGYRQELRGQGRRALTFGAFSTAGAVLGAILLLTLPGSAFDAIVPVLILIACTLIAIQPWLIRKLASVHKRHLGIAAAVGVFATGVYGGYFGAAQGVILIALFGIVLDDELQRLNALKNVLAAVANVVGAVVFIAVSHVAWTAAGLIAVSSVCGAQIGARYGRRIPPKPLRAIIVVVGTTVAVTLIARG